MSRFVELNASKVDPATLTSPRARALFGALESMEVPYITVVSAVRHKDDGSEGFIIDAEVELGQEPPVPLLRRERLALLFSQTDDSYPAVFALRETFPQVPHLNCLEHDVPKSLCLYEEPWDEVKLRWTPSGFLERIRHWLAATAEGTLHGDDQPLEPILNGRFWRLILPSDLFATSPSESAERLLVLKTREDDRFNILVAQRPSAGRQDRVDFVATTFQLPPQQHGIIRRQPRSLSDLAALMKVGSFDLLAELRKRMQCWDITAEMRKANLIVVAYFPKTRTVGGSAEIRDIWSFMLGDTLETLGEKLGLWQLRGGVIGKLLSPDLSTTGDDVLLDVLNTSFALNRSVAAALNGVSPNVSAIAAVGAGALGSQVIPKLMQSGFGVWTIIDDDFILPHNSARHQFSSAFVGHPKAELLARFCDGFFEGHGDAKGVVANLLSPGDKKAEVDAALTGASVIVDFSASIAVGRALARYPEASARRISVFMNPTGTDLVVLAEDSARTTRLDFLEMIYYAEVASNSRLEGHLARGKESVRYARSCRDLSSTVPEDLVGLHSSIGSRAIREAVAAEGALIKVWRSNPSLEVECITVPVPQPHSIEPAVEGWRLVTTKKLLEKVRALRAAKLPNETGGVFVGHFDTSTSTIFILDTIPAPPDSKEYPVHYIRGSAGLRVAVENIKDRTATMLHYLGEWHSHPDGYSCRPSKDDLKVFAWLMKWMQIDGYPGLMLIAGEDREAWFVGQMEQ
jgi:proteasome lid subunit RPN8/RPN11